MSAGVEGRRRLVRWQSSAALILIAASLSACESQEGHRVDAKICADFKTAAVVPPGSAAAVLSDAAGPVEDCLRRWAYSLAGARDGADLVAAATVAACGTALSRWNEASLNPQDPSPGPTESLSLVTGQPTNAMAEHNAFAHSRALLFVVQARAGRCAPPPMVKGAPLGV